MRSVLPRCPLPHAAKALSLARSLAPACLLVCCLLACGLLVACVDDPDRPPVTVPERKVWANGTDLPLLQRELSRARRLNLRILLEVPLADPSAQLLAFLRSAVSTQVAVELVPTLPEDGLDGGPLNRWSAQRYLTELPRFWEALRQAEALPSGIGLRYHPPQVLWSALEQSWSTNNLAAATFALRSAYLARDLGESELEAVWRTVSSWQVPVRALLPLVQFEEQILARASSLPFTIFQESLGTPLHLLPTSSSRSFEFDPDWYDRVLAPMTNQDQFTEYLMYSYAYGLFEEESLATELLYRHKGGVTFPEYSVTITAYLAAGGFFTNLIVGPLEVFLVQKNPTEWLALSSLTAQVPMLDPSVVEVRLRLQTWLAVVGATLESE